MSADTTVESPGPGRIALRGSLTFASVDSLSDEARRVLSAQQDGRVEVDLQGVDHVDSAGLALLITWLSAARAASVALSFRGVPERLRAIARISEVEGLLVESAAA